MITLNDFLTAMSVMNHNAAVLKSATNTLEDFLERENSYIWIEKPDGEQIVLEKGWKFHTAEILPIEVGEE